MSNKVKKGFVTCTTCRKRFPVTVINGSKMTYRCPHCGAKN